MRGIYFLIIGILQGVQKSCFFLGWRGHNFRIHGCVEKLGEDRQRKEHSSGIALQQVFQKRPSGNDGKVELRWNNEISGK
jgi:hypothetical protein